MAKMIDEKSEQYKGEAKVWQSFADYLADNVIIYNNREVNGREYDFCLLIENMGILIIEVKGWKPDTVTVLGVDNIIIDGYDKPQRSPKKQARAYRFAILNKVVEKYNTSPLVFDMVCYPFISEQDYINIGLNIVSEPGLTIFKEDLDDRDLLRKKIQKAYDITNIMPHADFSYDLILKIRNDLEPGLITKTDREKMHPYSILSVCPDTLSDIEVRTFVKNYFEGIKQIIFVQYDSDYRKIIYSVNEGLKNHNIDVIGNNLKVGYITNIEIGLNENVFRIFNMEIYLVQTLSQICTGKLVINEGNVNNNEENILKLLAEKTIFNVQQYCVEHASPEKNILVEAGAGTGKTYSMVSRVAFLCNKGMCPVSNIADEIAMVTFTNDAAINMRKRLKQMFVNYFILTGSEEYLKNVEDVDRANISTIHKFTLTILREQPLYTGLGTNFKISSDEHVRGQIYDMYLNNYLEEMQEDNSNFENEIPVAVYDLKKKIMGIADRLLEKSIDFDQIQGNQMGVTVENNIPYFNEIIQQVIFPAEREYLDSIKQGNNMDLKECIIVLNKILSSSCDSLNFLKIKYLFIDEFQDTDDIQIEVFQKLQKAMNAECRFFVVGDLKQSIYRFRGAKLSAFEKLQDSKVLDWDKHKLIINYRTDARLLQLLDKVFQRMGSDGILPYKGEGDRLSSSVVKETEYEQLFVCISSHAKDEDKFYEDIINIIKHEKTKLLKLMSLKSLSREERTIAILVRNNWQVEKIVESAKNEEDINIEIKTGGDLFQLPSTVDLYKLILALNNSGNPVYLVNFIESNYTDLKLDYHYLKELSEEKRRESICDVLDEFLMLRMQKTWRQLVEDAYTQPILFILKQIYEALQPWKQCSYQRDNQRLYMANYEFLIERMINFSRVDTLTLNQIAVYLEINILTGQRQLARTVEFEDEGIHIICMTVHKSKGLEYGTVILPYTYEDISDVKRVKLDANYSEAKFSYTVLFENEIKERNSNYNEKTEIDEQISEEARILYVALTRAIRNCVWIKNVDSNAVVSWGSILEE